MNMIIDKCLNKVNGENNFCQIDKRQGKQYSKGMIYETAMKMIDDFVNNEHKGNVASAARALGVKLPAFHRWYKRERTPNAEDLSYILEQLGVSLVYPSKEPTREICFINPKIVPAGREQQAPQSEDYMAVPLVDEVGAGPGIIPQGEILSWFLVYKHQDAVRFKTNLIAVQIGKKSTSMEPLLHPGDIVLVDLDNKDVSRPGHIMLVKDPDGAGKIKRVSTEARPGDFRITFYSDNAAENPPEVYSLKDDYFREWTSAVVGRVIWAWSDISGK